MAFIELGLNENEFFSLPPYRTYMMQAHNRRKNEKAWEQTRYLASWIHNTSMRAKRIIRPDRLIKLSFDKEQDYPEWTAENIDELKRKWPDIKKN